MQQALTILYGNASLRSISGQCAGYCAAGVAAIREHSIEYAPDAGIADLIWTEPRPAAEQNIWIKADAFAGRCVQSHPE
jgi:hypothetical protein